VQVVETATRLTMIRGIHEDSLSDGTVLFTTEHGPVYFVYETDNGLGMPALVRFSERGPSQHGDTDLGFLLEPRSLSYIFGVFAPGTTMDSRYLDTARMLLLARFRPARDPISLRYNRANGDVFQIDGHFAEGMQFGSAERIAGTWYQRFSVNFKMNDPIWYGPYQEVVTFTNDLWTGGLAVPFSVPVPVGSSDYSHGSIPLFYDGTWETYPDLRINGPITNPTILHDELDLSLPFEGSVQQGGYWDILLSSGSKRVVDHEGNSVMQYLSDPNNLDTFRIAADPDLTSGINRIRMTGTNANALTSLRITYTNRYIGI
jgi:hypothetical protein